MLYNQTNGSASNRSSMSLTIKKCIESQISYAFENSDGVLLQELHTDAFIERSIEKSENGKGYL